MKKKILIFIYLLLLTGCTVNYNIDISDNKIKESSNYYYENRMYDSNDHNAIFLETFEDFDNLSDIYLAFNENFEDKYYKKEMIHDSNGDGINLKYTYDFNNYGNSFLFNIFDDSNYVNNDGQIVIDVEEINLYDLYDYFTLLDENVSSLNINIKTNFKVLENNADSVKGNTYTWNINADSSNDKSLYIKIQKVDSKNEKINYTIIFVIITILLIIVIALVFYILKKKKENDEI